MLPSFGIPLLMKKISTSSLLVGLDRYYPLNGNGIDVVGGVNGAITGPSVAWPTGHVSATAMSLGASTANHFLAAPYGSGDFSTSFWFKTTTINIDSYSGIVGNMRSDSVTYGWTVLGGAGQQIVYYTDGNSSSGDVFGLIPFATWTHIAITRSGSAINTWKNGVLVHTLSLVPTGLIGDYFIIGSRPDGYNTTPIHIQDVGLWSRPITNTEISSLYNGGAGRAYPF